MRLIRSIACSVSVAALLGACSLSPRGEKFFGFLTPYRVEVVQGNVVTSEMISLIQPGMTRDQVKEFLGSPLITDAFHADRWDYVFTIRRAGAPAQRRVVTVYFDGDKLSRYVAPDLPSEKDFVNSIDTFKKVTPPPLALTPEQIKALPAPAPAASDSSGTFVAQGADRSYPPLESDTP
jgi:outer membrane protein assembly factor BamE